MTEEQSPQTDTPEEKKTFRRGIKSFVIRAGRLTKGQEGALERQWPKMGLELDQGPLNIAEEFGRNSTLR